LPVKTGAAWLDAMKGSGPFHAEPEVELASAAPVTAVVLRKTLCRHPGGQRFAAGIPPMAGSHAGEAAEERLAGSLIGHSARWSARNPCGAAEAAPRNVGRI